MIQIVVVKNPFNVSDRRIHEYECGQSTNWYIRQAANALPEMQLAASINGRILDQAEWSSIYPVDGDCIAICPIVQGSSFKSILRVVAMVAVMYYAGAAGKAFAKAGVGAATGQSVWGFSSYLAATAVQIVGGAIVNAILPPPKQQLPTYDSGSESATYGWTIPQSQLGQGGVWGRTYGTVMPAPQILSRHITSDGDKQYLNLLLCGGEGPVDSITNISIDNTPIESFEDVIVETRYGTNDQTAIGNFSDTYAEQVIGSELTLDKPVIRTTDGNSGQGIEVTLECPNGLYYAADDGGLSEATVEVEIQYKQHGDNSDEWQSFTYGIASGGVVAGSNNGKAVFSNIGAGAKVVAETWTITCSKATRNFNSRYHASIFSVVGSVSGPQADAIVGNSYDNGYVKFTINAGATGRVGDSYSITMIPDSRYIITAKKNTAVRKVFRVDNLPAGRYDVKCTCIKKSGVSNRHSTRIYWSQLTHIGYEDLSRPNKVLVGIKALATDQLSGSAPNITWEQTVSKVQVWDPALAAYVEKDATNPYWAAYDMVHGCKKLMNVTTGQYEYVVEGNPASRIIYEDFSQAAAYADVKDLKLNLFYDSAITMWDALDQATVIGRGRILTRGTKYGCICDKPGTPVQLFTMGNIVRGSFKGSFSSKKDRAKAVEVSFFNSEKNYSKDVAPYYGSDWDTTPEVLNPTQVERRGITSYEQAWREGEYLYKCNQYLLRSNTWEADVDAIACQIGDVVSLQHDIIKELTGQGGRIVKATSNTVTLDKTVELKAGIGYVIKIRTINEDTETEEVLTASIPAPPSDTLTDTVTVSQDFAIIPARYDIYAFGEADKTVKPFKVVAITRTDDLMCKISAVEYAEEIYTNSDAPPRNGSNSSPDPVEVVGITLQEQTYRQSDGTIVSLLHCGWSLPRGSSADAFMVYYSTNGGTNWQLAERAYITEAVLTVQQKQTYMVKICTARLFVISKGAVSEPIYITGKDTPPSNVPSAEASVDAANRTKILLSWAAVTDIDLKGYQVMEGSTVLTPSPISDTRYTYTAASSRQHTFYIRAVDNSGNLSEIPASISLNITVEPAQVAGFSIATQETDRSKLQLTWEANTESDISFYEIRQGDSWNIAQIIATQLKATSYTHDLTTEGSQRFLIKAVNAAGKVSINAAEQILQVILRPDAPTNLIAVQDAKDRSVLLLNWTVSPGKDIAGYELRRGTAWDTAEQLGSTRESFYRYTIPASSSFTIMVRAKTAAGYLSNVANITTSPMIEADDVTGFTAVQSISDRTKVRLIWDKPNSLDAPFYEIRIGAGWDTGTVVDSHVTGTFYETIITTEGEHIYWIKAITTAGNHSQNPAKHSGTFSLRPTAVSNIRIAQDENDRSQLLISWTGTSESDLSFYELRIGYKWDTAAKIAETKETRWVHPIGNTGDIKVIIKAKNAAGFYSDEVYGHYYATVEPGPVNGFTAIQNGEYVELFWDKHNESDVVSYEISEGASFDMGQLVVSGVTTTEYRIKVDTERNYYYHIKAINRALKYSTFSASKGLYVSNLPPKNVIQEYDEIALQTGAKTNVVFGPSLINWSNMGGQASDYPTTKFSDVGGKTVLKLAKNGTSYPTAGTYRAVTKDMGKVITANIAADFRSTVVLRGLGSAVLQIRTSQDGTNWSVWQDFKPAQYTFRYLDAQVLLATEDPANTPEVNHMALRIDVPDTDKAGTTVIPIGGAAVNYGHTYYSVPVLTPMAIGDNRSPVIISKTNTGFTARITDRTGTDTGGTLDWRAKGY